MEIANKLGDLSTYSSKNKIGMLVLRRDSVFILKIFIEHVLNAYSKSVVNEKHVFITFLDCSLKER